MTWKKSQLLTRKTFAWGDTVVGGGAREMEAIRCIGG